MDFLLRHFGLGRLYSGFEEYYSLTYPGSKMVEVKLTLLCGEYYPNSRTERIPTEITYADLQYRVNQLLNVRPCYQQIYFRGEELPVVEHPLRSVEDGEELSIKHSSFDHWIAFERHSQNARLAALSRLALDVQEHVERAISEYERLLNTFFLGTFSHLESLARDFLSEFYLYSYGKLTPTEFSSNSFFSTLYGDDSEYPTLKIKWKLKQRPFGSLLRAEKTQSCDVNRGETLLKTYYVRVHTKLAQQHDNKSADLRVLFMYKLLEILRLGPKVHFYRNTGQPGFGFYTASEEVPGFQNYFNRSSYGSLTYYQVKLFSFCFYLRDVMNRRKNYGVDSDGRPQIVHFRVTCPVHSAKRLADWYCDHEQGEKTKVGQACFSEWNLLSCIDMADKAIEKEKKLFEDLSFTFEPERDYAEYLTKIKSNVRYFTALFDRLEPPMSLVALCLRSVDPDQINFPLRHYRSYHCFGKKRFYRPRLIRIKQKRASSNELFDSTHL